ncbi:MAG: alpha-ketoglutarate-dependent dioxygenase AlkB [Myxococcota bacterium]
MEWFLDGRVGLARNLFSAQEAEAHFHALRNDIEWCHPFYDNPDGRRVFLPRLTANYGEESYDYSGLTFSPRPWTPRLSALRQVAIAHSGRPMNALILQLYRNGADRVGWHADDNPRQMAPPIIVSMSFGATRAMQFRAQHQHTARLDLILESGDLLLMQGDLQETHHHRIPSARGSIGERINLTFRTIKAV